MNGWFELWDSESANLIGSYQTELDAMAVVRTALATHGPGTISHVILVHDDDSAAEPRVIAAGPELVRLAEEKIAPLRSG